MKTRSFATQCDAESGGDSARPQRPPVQTPPASRQRVWLTLWMAAPLGVLTVLLLADTLHRAVGRGDSTERPPRGWLAALGHKGTASQWSSALGDLFAWSLADFHATLHRSMHRRTPDYDEYNLPTLENMCTRVRIGLDVGWPLNVSNYRSAKELCKALLALPEDLRIHTYSLPRAITSTGLLPALAPYFNRGYPVERYTLDNMRHGPFTERDMHAANAFLIPVAPYELRVAAFPGDGLVTVQHRVAAAVEAVKVAYPEAWQSRNGCDQVLVSAHDKGGRVAQLADHALVTRAVLVVNTADTYAANADEQGRYTQGKDVAGICSFSLSLPMWAVHLDVCRNGTDVVLQRDTLASFVGGGLGTVRQALFRHLEANPWEELNIIHGHISPSEYMHLLRTSKFCLVQSPRLIEILLFGCVPVIMADTYDLPLSDILDWSAFSVRLPQDEPQLLRDAIQKADYASLARNVCAVRRFFMFHAKPQPGDAFWMTMLELRRRLQAASSRPECVGSTAAAVQMNGTGA